MGHVQAADGEAIADRWDPGRGYEHTAISRLTRASINTVTKLMSDAADAAVAYHDEKVRGIRSHRHIQCDEIWGFVYANQGTLPYARSPPEHAGDTWTCNVLDYESKLIVSYRVGSRDGATAREFMDDLHSRVEDRMRLSTAGWKAYHEAVDEAFGGDVDFAQIIKEYGKAEGIDDERRYSPAWRSSSCRGHRTWTRRTPATSRGHNLSMRMGVRRLTRLTNGFSKRLEKYCEMLALYFHTYNHIRPHGSERTKRNNRVTPAMAAGLTDRPATYAELVDERAPDVQYARNYRKRKSYQGWSGSACAT